MARTGILFGVSGSARQGSSGRETVRRLYDSAEPLRRRQAFLERCGSRPDSFVDWALDLLGLVGGETVLDVGCGWGRFLLQVARRVGRGGFCLGVDLSPGVIQPAVRQLRDERLPAACALGDAEELPTRGGVFDVVLANHMLYHAADIDRALAELRRAMKPSGLLMATTNSERADPAVLVLHERVLAEIGVAAHREERSSFSMESGLARLRRHFASVRRFTYRDTQRFEDADALIALYRNTGRYRLLSEREDVERDTRATLLTRARRIAGSMAGPDGAIDSPVLMGAFLARPHR